MSYESAESFATNSFSLCTTSAWMSNFAFRSSRRHSSKCAGSSSTQRTRSCRLRRDCNISSSTFMVPSLQLHRVLPRNSVREFSARNCDAEPQAVWAQPATRLRDCRLSAAHRKKPGPALFHLVEIYVSFSDKVIESFTIVGVDRRPEADGKLRLLPVL